eukprot:9043394-Pyramimonas_sp.AAC.2
MVTYSYSELRQGLTNTEVSCSRKATNGVVSARPIPLAVAARTIAIYGTGFTTSAHPSENLPDNVPRRTVHTHTRLKVNWVDLSETGVEG